MEIKDYRKILSMIQPYAETIFFTGGGEPTLHPQIYQMIKEAKQKDIKRTWLLTNGTLLKEKDFSQIIQNKLDNLEITLDGMDKANHEKISVGSDFVKTVSNIKSFLEFRKKQGSNRPFTSIKIIKHSAEQPDMVTNEFSKIFRGAPPDRIYVKSLTYHSEYSRGFLEDEDFVGLNRNNIINRSWNNYFPCLSVYMQIMVISNGDVIACCGDLEGLNVTGNLLDENASVSAIWNNSNFKKLRQYLSEKKLYPPCTVCSQLWQGKPGSSLFDDFLLAGRLPMQMIRDFYPSLARLYYSIGIINKVARKRQTNKTSKGIR